METNLRFQQHYFKGTLKPLNCLDWSLGAFDWGGGEGFVCALCMTVRCRLPSAEHHGTAKQMLCNVGPP